MYIYVYDICIYTGKNLSTCICIRYVGLPDIMSLHLIVYDAEKEACHIQSAIWANWVVFSEQQLTCSHGKLWRKCVALRTGWRMGAFVFPPPLRWILDAMAVYASETHSAVSAPIQFGSLPAFRMHQDTEEQGNWDKKSYVVQPSVEIPHCGESLELTVREASKKYFIPSSASPQCFGLKIFKVHIKIWQFPGGSGNATLPNCLTAHLGCRGLYCGDAVEWSMWWNAICGTAHGWFLFMG